MSGQVLTRVVFDGRRKVEFRGEVLAAATTQRPGRPQWTEITVYRAASINEQGASGIYVVAKVGRSVLAHRRTCLDTNTSGMDSWRAAPEQGKRVPCLACNPQVDPPGSDVVVERDRHTLYRAFDQRELVRVIFPQRDARQLIGMTGQLIVQLCETDPTFARHWALAVQPQLSRE